MRNTSRDYQFTAHFTVITANKQVPEGDKIAKKKRTSAIPHVQNHIALVQNRKLSLSSFSAEQNG